MNKINKKFTSSIIVFSILPLTIRADFTSLVLFNKSAEIIGVLIFLEALIISLIRGTPRVIFILATPAKWNVFKVIWVPGSPRLWPPIAPTAVPGSIIDFLYLLKHTFKKCFNCFSVVLLQLSNVVCVTAIILYNNKNKNNKNEKKKKKKKKKKKLKIKYKKL